MAAGAGQQQGRPHLRVELAYGGARLAAELGEQARILNGDGLVKGRADRDTILVHDDDTNNPLVALQPLQRLLNFARLSRHL